MKKLFPIIGALVMLNSCVSDEVYNLDYVDNLNTKNRGGVGYEKIYKMCIGSRIFCNYI